jgi:uncharacterized protein DUF6632
MASSAAASHVTFPQCCSSSTSCGGVFFFLAARKPLAYVSFLSFTMWANLFHGLLMGVQAAMHMDRYWSKWFTDIPFVLILALGIYLWRPDEHESA